MSCYFAYVVCGIKIFDIMQGIWYTLDLHVNQFCLGIDTPVYKLLCQYV